MSLSKSYSEKLNKLQEETVIAINQTIGKFFASAKDTGSIKKINWEYNSYMIWLSFENKGPNVNGCQLEGFLNYMEDGSVNLTDGNGDEITLSGFDKKATEDMNEAIYLLDQMKETSNMSPGSNLEKLFVEKLRNKPIDKEKKTKTIF